MTTIDLIRSGVCDDLVEAFEQYPMDYFVDFGGGAGRRNGCRVPWLLPAGECAERPRGEDDPVDRRDV